MPRYHYERRYGGGHSTSASTDEDEQSGHDLASTRRMAAPRAISDATYTELVKILESESSVTFRDMTPPAKSAYRLVHRHKEQLVLDMVFDPIDGSEKERVCYLPTRDPTKKLILLRHSEVVKVINLYYERCKGDGARKLYKTITQIYCGLSEWKIQAALNRSTKRQELKPTFSNKPPLKPVQASSVWKQVQADLVSMEHMPSAVGETTYKYVLSVIDVFSRFLILRPVASKSAAEIADTLTGIFAEHGAPEIFQTDQGSEFKGSVDALMSKLKVNIIRSRPYHPQSQGKDERSHRTWKDYLAHDLKEDPRTNWVANLPVYMSLYNASPHSAIGHKTPFQVHFNRTPLTVTKPLLSGPRESDTDDSESHDSDLSDHSKAIRTEAKKSSERAATLMVQQQLALNPPSLYDIGDNVIVRLPIEERKKKSNKTKRMVYKGIVVKVDHDKHMYIVTYEDAGQYKTRQFSVRDLTSESLTAEKQRPKAAVARSKHSNKPKASKTKSKNTKLPTQNTSQTDSTMFKVTTRVATYA